MLILKNSYRKILFQVLLMCAAPFLIYSDDCTQSFRCFNRCKERMEMRSKNQNCRCECKNHIELSYYLNVQDFINSFIKIPTSNVLGDDSTTKSSTYLAGRASIYDKNDQKVGTCSASFLCMENESGIFTDISNYLSVDNGLIISWFTPTTLIDLKLDSLIHSMVTQCLVVASTKIGFNPFYGTTFNMVVSSDDEKVYFNLVNYR